MCALWVLPHLLLLLAGANNTKPVCPLVNGTAVPAIRPVAVPEITALQGGQILVGVNNTVPTQIKARLITEYMPHVLTVTDFTWAASPG